MKKTLLTRMVAAITLKKKMLKKTMRATTTKMI
jgi:hypothetical protein